jgi:hypothetical protein
VRAFRLDDDLGIRLRLPQAGGCLSPPDQLVTELIAVKGEAGFKVGDRYLKAVDSLDERAGHKI